MIIFKSLLKRVVFIEAAGAVGKIGSSLKPKHPNQVKLVEILSKTVKPIN